MRRDPPRRYHNFDLLRLVGALSVLFSHAFAITNGSERDEPLVRLLGPGNIFGVYGVYIFFIVSGFLISASFCNSGPTVYFVKRAFRIFPGLIACAFVSVALVTWLLSGTYQDYSYVRSAMSYIAKTILLLDTSSYGLPGVAFSQNEFGAILNGSLWSLGPEFACYLGVAALGLLGALGPWAAVAVLGIGLITHVTQALGNIGLVLPFFAAGSLLYFWKDRPQHAPWTWLLSLTGLIAGAWLGYPMPAFALFGAWLVIGFATLPWQVGHVTRYGDLSYGIYLYGWPIEQSVKYLLGPSAEWYQTFLISVPVAVLCAFLSWHLVEAPSLAFAARISGRLRRGGAAAAVIGARE